MPAASTNSDATSSATTHGIGNFFTRKASIFQSARARSDRDSSALDLPSHPQTYRPVTAEGPLGGGGGAGGAGTGAPGRGGAFGGSSGGGGGGGAVPLIPSSHLGPYHRNTSSQGGRSDRSGGTPVDDPASPRSRKKSRHSLSSSVTEFGNVIRRSTSLRSNNGSGRPPAPFAAGHPYGHSSANASASGFLSPDDSDRPHTGVSRSTLSLSSFTRRKKSIESLKSLKLASSGTLPPEGTYPTLEGSRASAMNITASSMRQPAPRPTGTSQSNVGFGESKSGSTPYLPPLQTSSAPGLPSMNVTFNHIHDMAAKRINTLDYLRKVYEGRTYYFNTLCFSQSDIRRLPSQQPPKLARRATNYLLLGFSLPQLLDLSTSQSAGEYLRTLNQLLLEFEQYQQMHPPEGGSGSLTKARLPHMFRRATGTGKGRRASSAADLGFPISDMPEPQSTISTIAPSFPSLSTQTSNSSIPGAIDSLSSSFTFTSTSWSSDPTFSSAAGSGAGESYSLLMTPNLPFDPDFFETFATLCDVLIDVYRGIMELVSTPERVAPGIGELFSKADAKVRKILVSGVVREFEDSARAGVKGEVAGVGKVVLGGLM